MTVTPEDFAASLLGKASVDLAERSARGQVSVADLAAYFSVFREYGALIAVAADEQGLAPADAEAWVHLARYAYRKRVEAFMLAVLDDWRKRAPRGKGAIRKFMNNTLPMACLSEVFPDILAIEWHQRDALHRMFAMIADLAGLLVSNRLAA